MVITIIISNNNVQTYTLFCMDYITVYNGGMSRTILYFYCYTIVVHAERRRVVVMTRRGNNMVISHNSKTTFRETRNRLRLVGERCAR